VNHYSQLHFVHLQINDSDVKTILAKKFATEHNVRIRHYHCNNGQFAGITFKQSCKASCQMLTFCGVNAHFHNGIAECAIPDLSESTHKQLFHACAQWLTVVHFALWPYTLQNATLVHNSLPVLEDGTSRLELHPNCTE
jgi:hypothetical protein